MNDIWELKEEKKKLTSKLKEKSIATKKAMFFASHYPYLDKGGMQILVLIATIILGSFLSTHIGFIGFFLPYMLWVGYDIYRMDELINKYNQPINKRLTEVNQLIAKHMEVKVAIEHTIKFLERFNKKAS